MNMLYETVNGTMNMLYILVGPSYSGMAEFVEKILTPTTENLQIVEESVLSAAQSIENIPNDTNTLYRMIACVVRAHLIKGRNVVARCDNLSVETLVMWKKMAKEHGAQCVIILFRSDLEETMGRIGQFSTTEDRKQLLRHKVNLQFKQYNELDAILTNRLSTITRDLADIVLLEEEYSDEFREDDI